MENEKTQTTKENEKKVLTLKELKQVTKDYKSITPTNKRLCKNILHTIYNINIKKEKLTESGQLISKLLITHEQKESLKKLSKEFLKKEFDFENLTNLQLCVAFSRAVSGTYTKIYSDKLTKTYGYSDKISTMDFWRNVGYMLQGNYQIDKPTKGKKVKETTPTAGKVTKEANEKAKATTTKKAK